MPLVARSDDAPVLMSPRSRGTVSSSLPRGAVASGLKMIEMLSLRRPVGRAEIGERATCPKGYLEARSGFVHHTMAWMGAGTMGGTWTYLLWARGDHIQNDPPHSLGVSSHGSDHSCIPPVLSDSGPILRDRIPTVRFAHVGRSGLSRHQVASPTSEGP